LTSRGEAFMQSLRNTNWSQGATKLHLEMFRRQRAVRRAATMRDDG
jgi:hypothetical protein